MLAETVEESAPRRRSEPVSEKRDREKRR